MPRTLRRSALCLVVFVAGCVVPDALESDPELGSSSSAVSVCADGPTTYGIDVSRFQGDMDWQKVADSGVKYAWIQVSRHVDDIDAKFEYNWAQAKEVGILRGAYQRFHPGESVPQQAQIMLDKLGEPQAGDLPPMLDVEDADGLGPSAVASAVQQWMDLVEPKIGAKPFIYTGYYFWKDSVKSTAFGDHPLWIANYSADCPLIPDGWDKWTIHQYSSTATIPGVTANTVDVNRFNGDMNALESYLLGGECGDAVCSAGETADSCAQDCPPCQIIDRKGGVVDDSSACFSAGGNPMYMRQEPAGEGGSLQWTNATDSATAANYGRWELFFAEGGTYRVEANTPAPFGESRQAVYQVAHGEEMTAVELDQSVVDGWSEIGEFSFQEGGAQFVRLDDNTGEANSTMTSIVFDALRFTRLDLMDDEDGEKDDDEEDEEQEGAGPNVGGGCAQGGTANLAGLLLLALMLAGGRRSRRRR